MCLKCCTYDHILFFGIKYLKNLVLLLSLTPGPFGNPLPFKIFRFGAAVAFSVIGLKYWSVSVGFLLVFWMDLESLILEKSITLKTGNRKA